MTAAVGLPKLSFAAAAILLLTLMTTILVAACDMFVDDSGASGSSFCDENDCWSLAGECHQERIPWDSTGEVSQCDLVVDYVNPDNEECPASFGDDEPRIDHEADSDGEETTHVFCKVPKLPAAQDCFEVTETQLNAIESQFGWYYCENLTSENFNEACEDDLDNDADGSTDCDDVECQDCEVCGGVGTSCADVCKYFVRLSDWAETGLGGLSIFIACPKS
jgi:hypothetical protein